MGDSDPVTKWFWTKFPKSNYYKLDSYILVHCEMIFTQYKVKTKRANPDG